MALSSTMNLLLCHRSNTWCFFVSKLRSIQRKQPPSSNAQFEGSRGVEMFPSVRTGRASHYWSADVQILIPSFLFHKSGFPPERRLHVLKIISSGRVIEWVPVFKWNWWNGGVCTDGKCVYKYAHWGQRLIPIDSAAVCIQHRWETAASVGNQLAQIHDKSYCLQPLISAGKAQPLHRQRLR